MKTYQTVSGHVIEYEPAPSVAKYLAKLQAMADKATEAELIAAVYSPDNPVMDAKFLPGRGIVTPVVLANPVYHVMVDILARKSMAVRDIEPADLAKNFTMTVATAADRLGITRAATYKAIDAGRLSSWMIGGQQMIDPRALETLDFKPRGPAGDQVRASQDPLSLLHGRDEDGNVLLVKHVDAPGRGAWSGDGPTPNATERRLDLWRRVGVFTSAKNGKPRFFVLEPSDKVNELKIGKLYVRGRFGIVEKVNSPRRAREAFESFQAA